jgi:hypothetical protein
MHSTHCGALLLSLKPACRVSASPDAFDAPATPQQALSADGVILLTTTTTPTTHPLTRHCGELIVVSHQRLQPPQLPHLRRQCGELVMAAAQRRQAAGCKTTTSEANWAATGAGARVWVAAGLAESWKGAGVS